MPTFEHPVQNANELRDAAQGLAHTTHRIDDPTCVYPVLCSLRSALESLSLSLHRLGELHDGPAPHGTGVDDDAAARRAASYQASWEMHRAGEMIHQVAECVDRAHELGARVAYDLADHLPDRARRTPASSSSHTLGPSL